MVYLITKGSVNNPSLLVTELVIVLCNVHETNSCYKSVSFSTTKSLFQLKRNRNLKTNWETLLAHYCARSDRNANLPIETCNEPVVVVVIDWHSDKSRFVLHLGNHHRSLLPLYSPSVPNRCCSWKYARENICPIHSHCELSPFVCYHPPPPLARSVWL